jgi:hypothetical protein
MDGDGIWFDPFDPPEVEHVTDHALLWPFVERGEELFFRGRPSSSHQAAADLQTRHLEVTDGWIPLWRYLNVSFADRIWELRP